VRLRVLVRVLVQVREQPGVALGGQRRWPGLVFHSRFFSARMILHLRFLRNIVSRMPRSGNEKESTSSALAPTLARSPAPFCLPEIRA
jgi:hypothetical protein